MLDAENTEQDTTALKEVHNLVEGDRNTMITRKEARWREQLVLPGKVTANFEGEETV